MGRLQGLRRDRQLRHRRLIAHRGLGDRPVGRAPGQRPALALHRLHGRRAQRLRGRRRPLRPRSARPHLPGEYQPRPDRPAGADALRRRWGGRGPVPRTGRVLGDLPNLRGRRPARVCRDSRRRPAGGAPPRGRRLGGRPRGPDRFQPGQRLRARALLRPVRSQPGRDSRLNDGARQLLGPARPAPRAAVGGLRHRRHAGPCRAFRPHSRGSRRHPPHLRPGPARWVGRIDAG